MIKHKKGICYGCQLERWIVHKALHLCVYCNKKRLEKLSVDRKKKKVEEGLALDPLKLDIFYQQYWNKHAERFCRNCGIELRTYKKWHIHHVIPKKYFNMYDKDIVFDDDNCIYLCLECHSKAETKLDTVPEIERITKEKYEEYAQYKRQVDSSPS